MFPCGCEVTIAGNQVGIKYCRTHGNAHELADCLRLVRDVCRHEPAMNTKEHEALAQRCTKVLVDTGCI